MDWWHLALLIWWRQSLFDAVLLLLAFVIWRIASRRPWSLEWTPNHPNRYPVPAELARNPRMNRSADGSILEGERFRFIQKPGARDTTHRVAMNTRTKDVSLFLYIAVLEGPE